MHQLPNLHPEEMDNLKTPVSIKKVELVMKNLPIKLLHFRELP